ncbi:Small-conductance mechanosensitive channel [marine gamma proteobacterium HTCC2143]|jgi:MscS family membrane protein|uniref:Small-conductance mechanosensitive channel n=1 Tax=marine gamma proteobacterium HTCC2143 TaxID=247633 RepID=A0YHC6_9GAMM|nr:Small-conductance mechanosensitive channel [marine gamma proteobacterium HTCC2143]
MENMQSLIESPSLLGLSFSEYPWVWEVFALVLITLFVRYALWLVLRKLELQFQKSDNLWDDAMLEAVRKPADFLVWLMGFSWVLEVLIEQSGAAIFTAIAPMRSLLFIALLAWFLIRVIKQVEQRLTSPEYTSDPVDTTTVLALGKLVRVAVFITSGLVIMQTMGYSISGVLAFGGVGGIAVGFAAKDLLANFFGGLMIYLDRPFSVGDWIRSPDQEIEGTVEDIGWRQTRIRTFDKRPLYIPNATFSHISVENPSRMLNRRIKETIGVRYDDAAVLPLILDDVEGMLRAHPDIDTSQTLMVNFNSFGPSSLDFFIYTFTRTTNWIEYHAIKQRILLTILDIIIGHGADVAFPTTTIKVPEPITSVNGLGGGDR